MSTTVRNIPPQFEVIDRPLETQMTLSMGPQHPSTHGVLRLELVLDGEMVVKCVPDIGYLHTGMEKLFEYKKYQQGIVITDRMDYLNPLGNNLGYVMAIEKLLQLEIPERAQIIRVMMCELQRIASHMVWLGTHALDLGAMSVFFYAFREREKILNLIEAASGGRLTPSYFRVGGLMMDLPPGFERRVRQFLDTFPKALDDFHTLLTENKIFQKRTQGIGVISAEDAIDWGVTGPSLRGSGVKIDVRKTNPYSGYETYDFEIPVETGGDVWSRYLVRMRELEESLKIIRQALDRLRPGPVKADAPKVVLPEREAMKTHMDALIHHFLIIAEGFNVPPGEVYHAIEGSKGELGFYIKSDGGPRPARVHVRAPSFVNLSALPHMVQGEMIADVVAVIGSIDIVLGEIDR
ncbi:MAG: NADH dehydrogenase (quinone) subunit D [Pyrinomonas methylaliphatogenes]|uniref:NADH-quinone oxidoreductase subunit D n=2 Tax=Pyrinomonas methylaliphatogenes TaxID=454194 RepID=A0A0B6WT83_9BACT|nr:NADH dehydrogenase (quinone) subunit D [Pyrinomonas methylaliphatogenes]MBX5478031.1 NADH dehydrogenase (quinone) subunit D [Pyrinomonas methylaliphatogenes]CDM64433.1 NADH dehydrogenase subunit D [Pyrinomonas methylaliphatogenes]